MRSAVRRVRVRLALTALWLWDRFGWRWALGYFGALLPSDYFGDGCDCVVGCEACRGGVPF